MSSGFQALVAVYGSVPPFPPVVRLLTLVDAVGVVVVGVFQDMVRYEPKTPMGKGRSSPAEIPIVLPSVLLFHCILGSNTDTNAPHLRFLA